LPRLLLAAEERGVPGPWMTIEVSNIGKEPGTQRIAVDVAHELQKIGTILDKDGLR
jgi:hypothetical protein